MSMYNRQVKFSWDEEKATEVEREHHIGFAKIIEIFSDLLPLNLKT